MWELTYPVNNKTGASHQRTYNKLETFIDSACDIIPGELYRNSWNACGYKYDKYLIRDKTEPIVAYNEEHIGAMMSQVIVNESHIKF